MSRIKKHLVVSYQRAWGEDGTVYDQKIKIDKTFLRYINKLIKRYHESDAALQEITAASVGFSTYYDCYLTEIDTKERFNYTTQTQLAFIYYYLSVNNYDVSRIKRRNTIIEMV